VAHACATCRKQYSRCFRGSYVQFPLGRLVANPDRRQVCSGSCPGQRPGRGLLGRRPGRMQDSIVEIGHEPGRRPKRTFQCLKLLL